MMKIIYIFGIFTIIQSTRIEAQMYEATPCFTNYEILTKSQMRDFKNSFEQDLSTMTLHRSYSEFYPNSQANWSTTSLKPSGKPPKKTQTFNFGSNREEVYNSKYIQWSCMYSAFSSQDKKTDTGWSEGIQGDGLGESLYAIVNILEPIKIWGGFGKNIKTFVDNNRPKDLEIKIYVSTCGSDAMHYEVRTGFHLLGEFSYELEDINDFQPLVIPTEIIQKYKTSFNEDNFNYPEECFTKNMITFLKIKFKSVYRGKKFRNTFITEISN